MGSEYEKKLTRANQQLDGIKSEMEKVRHEFLSDSLPFIVEIWKRNAKQAVLAEQELTRKLGQGKLSELKDELEEMYKTAPEILTNTAGDKEHWWHLKPGEKYYFVSNNRLSKELESALRYAAGHVASILETYGYLKRRDGGSNWRPYDASGIHQLQNERCYLSHGLSNIPPRLVEHARKYAELLRTAESKKGGIEKIIQEEELRKTKKLWDEA